MAAWNDHAVKVGFYLPSDLVERLKAVAADEDRPVSRIVRRLIEQYVDGKKRARKRTR
jgi:predicted DNA-binding protein